MSDTRNSYEAMFLFPQAAASNLKEAADHVNELLARADAEIVAFSKWDERRLAYEIKGNKRGVYFLTYFKAEPEKIAPMERACNLSEQLLRVMVTRADFIPADLIEATDGRDKLADEIKLRGDKADKGRGRETSRVSDGSEKAAEAPAEAPAADAGDAGAGEAAEKPAEAAPAAGD